MPSSDPVGDMLAMIKNAYGRRHKRMSLPHSRMKEGVAKVLRSEGYIEDVKSIQDEKKPERKTLHLYLKYDSNGESVISEIKRVSKPGCRIFRGVDSLGRIMDGLGVQVLSTSKGIMSDRQARKDRVGGELICKVW
ncbi:MAG TPA: 30S ribosomal protein S8 [Planctomycetota bacterium]|nr:30S ribosomal protein S8 [Planctomycetota bacterium]